MKLYLVNLATTLPACGWLAASASASPSSAFISASESESQSESKLQPTLTMNTSKNTKLNTSAASEINKHKYNNILDRPAVYDRMQTWQKINHQIDIWQCALSTLKTYSEEILSFYFATYEATKETMNNTNRPKQLPNIIPQANGEEEIDLPMAGYMLCDPYDEYCKTLIDILTNPGKSINKNSDNIHHNNNELVTTTATTGSSSGIDAIYQQLLADRNMVFHHQTEKINSGSICTISFYTLLCCLFILLFLH